jgi:L-ribulokinase
VSREHLTVGGHRRVAIGVGFGFGTMSGRVLLLDLRTGEEVAIAEVAYPHGVIDARLPVTSVKLPPDTTLQDPGDYLVVFYQGIPEGLESGGVRAEEVIGIGVDFTACTVCR